MITDDLPVWRTKKYADLTLQGVSGDGVFSGYASLFGEVGAEAVMPLKRGPDGALGVAAESGGVRIVFNVTTPDAVSFRKSEGQIAAMLTRAVGRGQRSL